MNVKERASEKCRWFRFKIPCCQLGRLSCSFSVRLSCFSIFRPHYLGFCGMVRIGGESGQRKHDRMAKMDNFEMHLALHRNSRRVGFVHSCALFL